MGDQFQCYHPVCYDDTTKDVRVERTFGRPAPHHAAHTVDPSLRQKTYEQTFGT